MRYWSSSRPDGIDLPLVLSAEVFDIPLEDSKHIIYAPLRRAAFIGNAYIAEFISRLQLGKGQWPGGREDSSMVSLLQSLQIIGAGPEPRPLNSWSNPPQPTSLTLFLTTACNLRCHYCYASAGSGRAKFMSMDVARRGIDFVAANAARKGARRIELSFHGGGEPTLHWRVLTQSVLYARRKAADLALQVTATLATNGVLPDRKIDWILASLDGVNISCDGLPSIHDQCRPTASGEGSSGQVLHTLHRFDEAGLRYGIRLTLLAEHIPSLPDSVEFLCSNFSPDNIQIEPVYLLGRGSRQRTAETDEFIDAFRTAQWNAAAHGRRLFFSGARVGSLTNHFCSATQENFCLSADGSVSACHEAFSDESPQAEVFFYGRPDPNTRGFFFDQQVLDHLRDQAVENRAHCRGCFAKWSCGGDCYYKWRAHSGGGEFDGSARCHIIRELTKDQILEKIEASGGMIWHDQPPPVPDQT